MRAWGIGGLGSSKTVRNPFRSLAIACDADAMSSYAGKSAGEMPAHVFAVATRALLGVARTGIGQSIVLTGESGAGKTESAKLVKPQPLMNLSCPSARFQQHAHTGNASLLQATNCLATMSGSTGAENAGGGGVLKARVQSATQILEAFGNCSQCRVISIVVPPFPFRLKHLSK